MINYLKTVDGKMTLLDEPEIGCWINCVAPKDEDLDLLISKFNVNPDFLRASIDDEETSHIDFEDGETLIIMNIPFVEKLEGDIVYDTVPLGMMVNENNVITVCIKDTPILAEFEDGAVKNVNTSFKTQFILFIMLKIASKYLQYLKQIDKISYYAEKELRKSMRNKELIDLLEVQKSLVYFSSSLKANEATLEKIMRGRVLKLYEEDQDLLDDVLIEIRQAIEMSSIYLNILSGTMDAYGSVISNNLNIVMKILASITLIISIPTVISGIYGMNVDNIPYSGNFWFPIILSVILMAISAIVLRNKRML